MGTLTELLRSINILLVPHTLPHSARPVQDVLLVFLSLEVLFFGAPTHITYAYLRP
jgi:hypothetical protein